MRRAAAWDPVRLPVLWWEGDPPAPGDGLETSTGRRYLILSVIARPGTVRPKRLDCVVLPPGEPIAGEIFRWQWAPRRSRRLDRR